MPRNLPSAADKIADSISYTSFGWRGGMRNDVESYDMEDNEYLLGVNIRNRLGRISTIKNPKQLTNGLPAGSNPIQGIYGAGGIVVVIIKGRLYYRDFQDTRIDYFKTLTGFTLDPNVERIWAEIVPASTINFVRKSTTNVDLDPQASDPITFGAISGQVSPQVMLVMDGINQALGITPKGNVFRTQNFQQWSLQQGRREYVPIGIMPMYNGGILYIVSPDKKEVYRSVTGRPLDFVVAIDQDGDKIQDGTFAVEASRLAIRPFGFDNITCISRISIPDEGFFASTLNTCSLISVDRNNTLFGEPTFTFQSLFPTGVTNKFSIIDNLGDTAFVDISGIRTFNAIQQTRVEGRNAPFTQKLSFMFPDTILQNNSCAVEFNNYSIFSVETIYGSVLLVYDTLTQSWVSIDKYDNVGKITQFAEIKYAGVRRLFFANDSGQVYEAFADSTVANWKVYLKEMTTDKPEIEQKLDRARFVFQNILQDGSITVTNFVDRRLGQTLSKTVSMNASASINVAPIEFPFGASNEDAIDNFTYTFPEANRGWKIGLFVEGNVECELIGVEVLANIMTGKTSIEQQAKVYA